MKKADNDVISTLCDDHKLLVCLHTFEARQGCPAIAEMRRKAASRFACFLLAILSVPGASRLFQHLHVHREYKYERKRDTHGSLLEL